MNSRKALKCSALVFATSLSIGMLCLAQQGPPGGRSGFRVGSVLPPFVRARIELTPEQTGQIADLEASVATKLKSLLTQQQLDQLANAPPPPGFGPPGGNMPQPRRRAVIDTTPDPTPGPMLTLSGTLKPVNDPKTGRVFSLSGQVDEGILGDHRTEISGRGLRFHSAKSTDSKTPSQAAASVMLKGLAPADGRWLRVRIKALAQEGFAVENANLYLRVDYFSGNGTNQLDYVKKSIYQALLDDRQNLADPGANASLGNARWREYSINVRTPMPEVDALKVSIGFDNGAGTAENSDFWVSELEVTSTPDPAGYAPPQKPASDKNPPALASLVPIGGRWYYDPRGGDRAIPARFDQTNADRLFYRTDRLEAPFANNTTAWLRKGYYDINGEVVTKDRFVADSVVISFTKTHLVMQAKNLPNHPTAVFPDRSRFLDGNPGAIGEQANTWYIPVEPKLNPSPAAITPENGRALPMGPIGVAVNGVVFYNPFDAGIEEAIRRLDRCCGHPGPNSTYHYHKYPSCVNTPWDDDGSAHSPLLGFAFDGIGVYGPYEAKHELARESKTNPLNEFNVHTDPARGPHYHVTPGQFPHIIGGYWGILDPKNRRGLGMRP